jgi:hypothetical protein
MNDEEVAFRIVRLYFEEIARLGFKRQLDIDQIINAYFYTLKKLDNKDEAMREAVRKIVAEEKGEENLPAKSTTTSITKTTTETSNTSTNNKSISDIVEGR